MDGEFQRFIKSIYEMFATPSVLTDRGAYLEITHRFWTPGAVCTPGEEVFGITALWRGRSQSLPYSTKQCAMADYLARYQRGQTATQIAVGMNTHPFFGDHARHAKGVRKIGIRINRTSIKADIEQMRAIAVEGFRKLGLSITRADVIESIKAGKEVQYKLKARVSIRHVQY